MKTILRNIPFLVILLLVSCKEEKQTPKVIYEEVKTIIEPKKVDTSSIKIADLPILMEGTNYLIHPVGDVRVYDDYSKVYGSSKTNQVSYAISNYNRFELTGYFENLKFQHIDSINVKPLTEDKIQIQTVTYLNTIAEKTRKQILVYTLVDDDTNKDGKIDQNDIKSLYLSLIDGSDFVKISEPLQELIDWNIIETQNRLYLRCIEDINKNGAFDKKDKVHYHFVNLLADDWKVEEYMPI
ncbi:hypothetical protein SY27_05415 [Flavobacterium sp. 316]|uniref:EF-hand domain-containing protein n=1 Tax=Flavobacterium sediminilitoris TaxID=2024526 RepID=A0ABY4HJB4_9FLAO|nr:MULTISPECIES: hypothetical protein [Flavobacterium]KIX22103.1 hypothetical protein SY27_05415 [Flavobacterium sp. 316]UOX32347.1 hypothetical protein LXD69_09815 [Flavobacterium sediminilitoris]